MGRRHNYGGGGHGGRGRAPGRGSGGSNNHNNSNSAKPTVSTSKPELKECVFCINRHDQATNFEDVKDKLITWAGEECKEGGHLMSALEDGVAYNPTEPQPNMGSGLVADMGEFGILAKNGPKSD